MTEKRAEKVVRYTIVAVVVGVVTLALHTWVAAPVGCDPECRVAGRFIAVVFALFSVPFVALADDL